MPFEARFYLWQYFLALKQDPDRYAKFVQMRDIGLSAIPVLIQSHLSQGKAVGSILNVYSMSLPRPSTNWADWSDALGREMYLRRVLDQLNFEYPPDSAL
jgi:hypothetical protein